MRKPSVPVEIVIEDPAWRKLGKAFAERIEEASNLALKQKNLSSPASAQSAHSPGMTILLTDDARLRTLNAIFRGKDKPTNVLAFPSDAPDYLGDIAIAHGVAAAEARREKKRLIDHAVHLTIHGTLHLLGYDHVRSREAQIMEALETRLLARLGIADPYAGAKAAKR